MFKKLLTTNTYSDILYLKKNEQTFEKGQESEDRQMKTQRRKKYRITSKFRFITSIVVMLMLAIGIFGTISGLNTSRAITKPQYVQVEVCYGDTLWDIANTYKSDDTDTRKAIFEICKINNIEVSDMSPGMVLSIPEDL